MRPGGAGGVAEAERSETSTPPWPGVRFAGLAPALTPTPAASAKLGPGSRRLQNLADGAPLTLAVRQHHLLVILGRGDPLLPLTLRDPLLPRRLKLYLLPGGLILRPLNRGEHHHLIAPRLALFLLALFLLPGGSAAKPPAAAGQSPPASSPLQSCPCPSSRPDPAQRRPAAPVHRRPLQRQGPRSRCRRARDRRSPSGPSQPWGASTRRGAP